MTSTVLIKGDANAVDTLEALLVDEGYQPVRPRIENFNAEDAVVTILVSIPTAIVSAVVERLIAKAFPGRPPTVRIIVDGVDLNRPQDTKEK